MKAKKFVPILVEIEEPGLYHFIGNPNDHAEIDIPDLNEMSLGFLIRYYRTIFKLTLKDVYSETGIQVCQLSKYENDICPPRNESLKKLEKLFGEKFSGLARKILQRRLAS